jgi:hypothetical protein
MSATLDELEKRIRKLEDVNEINDAFFKWHYDCTGGFNGKQAGRMEALECLTDDAMIDVPPNEPGKGPKGREQFTEFWDYFYGDAGPLPYVFQTCVAELVTVDGDTAVQKANQFAFIGFRGAPPSVGLSQRTNNFVRTADGWRINYTNIEGGVSFKVGELHGNLNKLPEFDGRQPWKYKD